MNMMTDFANETQMTQTEACFNMAMCRVREGYGEEAINRVSAENMENFQTKLWNNLALSVIKEGYEAAKDYARNARFVI